MTDRFKNAFECYEAIGRWLTEEAPEPWKQITVNFRIIKLDDVSERSILYVPMKGTREKQFSIYDTNFTACFFSLAKLTSTPEKGLFKKCRYTLHSDGRYNSEFEY